ncbi:hypothetical protein EON82_07790 [bacterium]|nr:MAG: hypothetical protein EON82_07790 [bacterium]
MEDALLESAFVRALQRDIVASEARSERLDWLSKDCYHTARRTYAAQALARGDLAEARRQLENARAALRKVEAVDPNAPLATPRMFLSLVEEMVKSSE